MSDTSYSTKENTNFLNTQGGEKKVMKKILSVALSTAMAFSMFASVAFADTAATPKDKFDALAAKGILNGYPDGQAHLEKDLTRAEFAKIVTKLFNLTEVSNKLSYKDKGYNAKNWAVPYIEAVTAANLMQGKDTVKGIFDYNGKVTVEEVAAVLFRALKLEAPATTDNTASAWAKGYAQAVIEKGIGLTKETNFKANATRSLVVEAAYAVDQLAAAPTVASAEAVSPTKVVVTFSDKTTTTVELTTALVAGTETTINFKHNNHDYTTKVTLAAPKVVSVTAPNAKQVVVKFNRAVDGDTIAENDKVLDGVIKVTQVGSKEDVASNAYVTFNSDNTEATVTIPGTKNIKGNYNVVVSDAVKTTAGEAIPAFTTLLNITDTVAPTVASVTATAKATTKDVYVKFSEPVKTTGIVAYVNGSAAAVSVTNDSYTEFKLTGVSLDSGKTYDVSLLNVTDYAGNVATPNPIKTTVAVSSDVAAPVIKSVTPVSDRFVEVEFDKAVDRASLVGNVRLLNSVGESQGTFTVITTGNGKKFTLRSPLGSFPSSGTFTGSVVFGATVKDTLGNVLGAASSQAITFTKDTVAPTVTGITYTTNTSVKGLKLSFSEEVVNTGNGVVTLINNKTGESRAIGNTTNSSNGKTLVLAAAITSGDYTVRIPEGLFVDKSFAANKLAATVLTVSVAAEANEGDAPVLFHNGIVINDSTVTGTVYGDAKVTVDLKDASGLNVASVLDVNSYTLNDKALPAGSYVTIQTLDSAGAPAASSSTPKYARAIINIPSSSIEETKTNHKFLVNGVTDVNGNTINAVWTTGTLTSRTSPALDSAVVNSSNSYELILGFSKEVTSLTEADLEIYINNDAGTGRLKTDRTDYTVVQIANGSDKGKWSVTIKKAAIGATPAGDALDLNSNDVNRIIVKTVKTPTGHDKDGNKVSGEKEINVK